MLSPATGFTQPWLHDSRLTGNLFEGLTVPVLSFSQLGTVFLASNTVRASYGGFWLVSSADLATMYKAVLGPLAFPTSTVLPTVAYGPLIDRIFVLVAAIGRSMTYQSPVPPPPNLSAIARLRNVLGAQQVQTTVTQLAIQQALQQEQAQNPPAGPAAAPVAAAHAESLDLLTPALAPVQTVTSISPTSPIRIPVNVPTAPHSPVLGTVNPVFLNPVILQPAPPIIPVFPIPSLPVVPPPTPADYTVRGGADVGTSLVLRVTISGNQVNAVIANSYSGAGLILVDQAAAPGSVLVSDNRIRSRVPMGAAAWLTNLVECVVTGNTIRNEAIAAGQVVPLASPYSILVVVPVTSTPSTPSIDPASAATIGLVVSGNVLVGATMQALPRPGAAAPMNDWGIFNTVTTFNPPAPANPPPPAPAPASSP